MTNMQADIAAYEKMLPELRAEHIGQWVVFRGGVLIKGST